MLLSFQYWMVQKYILKLWKEGESVSLLKLTSLAFQNRWLVWRRTSLDILPAAWYKFMIHMPNISTWFTSAQREAWITDLIWIQFLNPVFLTKKKEKMK